MPVAAFLRHTSCGMKAARSLLLLFVLSTSLTTLPVQAAEPSSGTITSKRQQVRWSGGPFYISKPVGSCTIMDPNCEVFLLRVDLRKRTDIQVRVAATTPASPCCEGPAPVGGDDYDVYVWDHTGIVAEANENNQGVETLIFTHTAAHVKEAYEIEVIPYNVAPGSTYTASAKVITLGRDGRR